MATENTGLLASLMSSTTVDEDPPPSDSSSSSDDDGDDEVSTRLAEHDTLLEEHSKKIGEVEEKLSGGAVVSETSLQVDLTANETATRLSQGAPIKSSDIAALL